MYKWTYLVFFGGATDRCQCRRYYSTTLVLILICEGFIPTCSTYIIVPYLGGPCLIYSHKPYFSEDLCIHTSIPQLDGRVRPMPNAQCPIHNAHMVETKASVGFTLCSDWRRNGDTREGSLFQLLSAQLEKAPRLRGRNPGEGNRSGPPAPAPAPASAAAASRRESSASRRAGSPMLPPPRVPAPQGPTAPGAAGAADGCGRGSPPPPPPPRSER